MTEPTTAPPASKAALDLPFIAIIGLALLAVPRAVLHDLGVVQAETFLNMLLAVGPVLVWIVVVAMRGRSRPFLTGLAIGGCYGVFLALVHQLLWDASFAGGAPELGGNLAGLDPAAQAVIFRTFAVVSSLFTGLAVGAITGLLAWALGALLRRNRPPRAS